MAFYADTFVFDGVNCSAYDLILLDVHQGQSDSSQFASGPSISEDFVNRKWKPYFYGVTRQEKLTFQMSVGLNACRMQEGTWLTRAEIANIMKWLTGPDTYRLLYIEQDDMMNAAVGNNDPLPKYRYKCMVTSAELQFIDDKPWGLTFTVTCDSPYAYQGISPRSSTGSMEVNNHLELSPVSDSCIDGLYYPTMSFAYLRATPSFLRIKNNTTDQTMTLSDIPSDVTRIDIDCEHGTIVSTPARNLYAGFNFVFIGLTQGTNNISITNTSTAQSGTGRPTINVTISGYYPIDIGA